MNGAISIENNGEEKKQKNLGFGDNTIIPNSDVLFYVKSVYPDNFQIQDYYQWQKIQEISALRNPEEAFNAIKAENTEITKETFRKIIADISLVLENLLKKENRDPNPQPPYSFENDRTVEGFSLEEIEVNFNIEAGFKVFLEAKANSGITLKFKRK